MTHTIDHDLRLRAGTATDRLYSVITLYPDGAIAAEHFPTSAQRAASLHQRLADLTGTTVPQTETEASVTAALARLLAPATLHLASARLDHDTGGYRPAIEQST